MKTKLSVLGIVKYVGLGFLTGFLVSPIYAQTRTIAIQGIKNPTPGIELTIPFQIDNAEGIEGIRIEIKFPDLTPDYPLEFVRWSVEGTLTEGWTLLQNDASKTGGFISVIAAHYNALHGSGVLINLIVKLRRAIGNAAALESREGTRLNDGAISVQCKTGYIGNNVPQANNLLTIGYEDTAASITLNGTDADNDPLQFTIVSNPSHGNLSGSAPNLTYMPAYNYFGYDFFTYQVSDGVATSNIVTFSINVMEVNDPPTIQVSNQTVLIDDWLQFTVYGYDPDGDWISYSSSNLPEGATFGETNGEFRWTPQKNQIGTHYISFRVQDGRGLYATASIIITVQGRPTPTATKTPTTTHTPTPTPTRPSKIQLLPPYLFFEDVIVGVTKELSMKLTNVGDVLLEGTVTVDPPFHILSSPNYQLGSKESITVVVGFAPTSNGYFDQEAIFTGGGGFKARMVGTGYIFTDYSPTPKPTPTVTFTSKPTGTATRTPLRTPTDTPINTPTQTNTPIITPENSPSNTATPVSTSEIPPSPTATPTVTPTESVTDTLTPTPPVTSTPTVPHLPTPTPVYTPTLTPTFYIPNFPFPEAPDIKLPAVLVFDNPYDTAGDLTGNTDLDRLETRNLTIVWNVYQGAATDWHIYVRKGYGGMKYLGRAGRGDTNRFHWYSGAPGVSAEFRAGPEFNTAYTFRVIRIDDSLDTTDLFEQTGWVGFNFIGGDPLLLTEPAMPNLKARQVCVFDDLFGGNDLAPSGSIGMDVDDVQWRALQIAWNFGLESAVVNEYHIRVSVDGQPFQFLGQTGTGKLNYFWWTSKNVFKTAPAFASGPQGGHVYQFQVVMMPWVGGAQSLTSGTLNYLVEAIPTPTPTPLPPPPPADAITVALPNLPESAQPLDMIWVKPGSFMMGSPNEEAERDANEGPQHTVRITQGFYLGKMEITQGQWQAVMGNNPAFYSDDPNQPIENVSWFACREFLQKLNVLGLGVFRLPTEAEWEYACRAGTTTRYFWGDDPTYILIGQYAWYDVNNYPNGTKVVGLKLPNAWGFYDMSGNVSEWCLDWYAPYTAGSQIDPIGPSDGQLKVIRGGGFGNISKYFRSATRQSKSPAHSGANLGLRIVKENR